MAVKINLRVGERALGTWTRDELLDLHAAVSGLLECDRERASAWLELTATERQQINSVIDAVGWWYDHAFALGSSSEAVERRIACALIRELLPDVPVAAVAAAVRVSVRTVEAKARRVREWTRLNEYARLQLDQLRTAAKKRLSGKAD